MSDEQVPADTLTGSVTRSVSPESRTTDTRARRYTQNIRRRLSDLERVVALMINLDLDDYGVGVLETTSAAELRAYADAQQQSDTLDDIADLDATEFGLSILEATDEEDACETIGAERALEDENTVSLTDLAQVVSDMLRYMVDDLGYPLSTDAEVRLYEGALK